MTALQREEKGGGESEAEDRGEQERLTDVGGLGPVDAAGSAAGVHELVGDADADDGADEGVRAGSREAELPGAEVPEDGGGQQGEDHGEAGAGADLQDQFDGEEGNDAEGDGAGGGDDAGEIPEAGPDDGDLRIHRVGVDDGGDGVGGVVEAVDEFEGESDEKRDAQENVGPRGEMTCECRNEVVSDTGADKDEAADEDAGEDQCAELCSVSWRACRESNVSLACCRARSVAEALPLLLLWLLLLKP